MTHMALIPLREPGYAPCCCDIGEIISRQYCPALMCQNELKVLWLQTLTPKYSIIDEAAMATATGSKQ